MLVQTITLLSEEDYGRMGEVLAGPFPSRVRGCDAWCKRFELQAEVENLSANHLYLKLDCCMQAAAKLFIITKIYRATVALRGEVVEVEQVSDERTRMRVRIRSHRFLHVG
jgi:hypothetical protein